MFTLTQTLLFIATLDLNLLSILGDDHLAFTKHEPLSNLGGHEDHEVTSFRSGDILMSKLSVR